MFFLPLCTVTPRKTNLVKRELKLNVYFETGSFEISMLMIPFFRQACTPILTVNKGEIFGKATGLYPFQLSYFSPAVAIIYGQI